jgi:hypothetical protein
MAQAPSPRLSDSEATLRECDELDTQLAELKAAYDQYFLGFERLPPLKMHERFKKRLQALRTSSIRSTAAKFRSNSLQAKVVTYERLWEKSLQERENGTYRRDLAKVARKLRSPGRDADKKKSSPGAVQLDEGLDETDALLSALTEMEDPAPPPSAPKPALAAAPAAKPAPLAPAVPPAPPAPAVLAPPGVAAPPGLRPSVPSPPSFRPQGTPAAGVPAVPAAAALPQPPLVPRAPAIPPPPQLGGVRPPPAAGPAGLAARAGAASPVPPVAPPLSRAAVPAVPSVGAAAPPAMAPRPATPPRGAPAAEARAPVPATPPAGGLSEAKLKAVYDAYITAKRRCNEDTSSLSFDRVAGDLRRQVSDLMRKDGAKAVEFKVVIKEGRAELRTVPKA